MRAKSWGKDGELSLSVVLGWEQNAHVDVVVDVADHLCRELEGTTRDEVAGIETLVLDS